MLLFWALLLRLSCLTMAIPSLHGVSQEGQSLKQPEERAERSLPDSETGPEERMREFLDNFKAEVLEKFREQEEKNAEQDLKIAKQSEKILKLEETIAEQQKTIGARPDSDAEVEAPFTGQQEQESLLLITGSWVESGLSYSFSSSTEIFPSTSNCSLPSLPSSGRSGHTMFVTSEPHAQVAACGGQIEKGRWSGYTASCLVLDQVNQRWDESRMGDLTMKRSDGAAARLDNIGVYIVGGTVSESHPDGRNSETIEFLAAGTMQWQEGPTPTPPFSFHQPCAVTITPTSFLIIHESEILEFDAATDGPTGLDGWKSGYWPQLKTARVEQGCAKVGQKVIIAGGYNPNDAYAEVLLRSTEVLDLVSRQITSGGDLAVGRRLFHVGTIFSGGEEKMFALAGTTDRWNPPEGGLNSTEEWVEESSTWRKGMSGLVEGRAAFAAVTVPAKLICPV